ncbi:NAD(P)-dependent oxidoreductase [Pseudomonas typographi]|uniref:2-hydroxyacid dehydrogenase n=1 Tax=Pseudomonas typographi TaxID=2715964 RepID=A0ABR7Z1X8_9PSED|nr:NAD(P)-dependent oxidoreductase [Pseudomonas typographi]MBD1551489.1 2-hydroxyacid dehydrogenase [Pseudomonas typographi]MBD1587525.1 2-hydroxyacid dehydrogenase [Pseudomonas typographi]MBD1599392.1 2-hydroxyacid dehydrogenase [Pseudomonas typographi]
MPPERLEALVLIELPGHLQERLLSHMAARFEPSAEPLRPTAQNATVQVLLSNGARGASAADIDALPALALICSIGAGYEHIDVGYAHSKGIAVTHGAGANAEIVADHAMALLLAVVRSIPRMDRAARAGADLRTLPVDPGLHRKRLGLLGGGHVAAAVARRAAGFDMALGYHARHDRGQLPYRYFATPLMLAAWCDVLLVAVPGGIETLHMVNLEVLRALGPAGYLVNVGRGSVVDSQALADALRLQLIAGAALDVYEGEPRAPAALCGFHNVVFTPHIGGRSEQAALAQVKLFLDNAQRLKDRRDFINRL